MGKPVRNGRQMGSFEGHAQRMLTPSPQTPHPPYAPAESNFLSITGTISYGVRVFDDEGQAYDNSWNSIPDDDMAVLRLVTTLDDEIIGAFLDFIRDSNRRV
jgi:hypothetical protein